MTCEGLGEMFEGDSEDTCARKFPLVSMGGRAEGLACAETGEPTTIGVSGNLSTNFYTIDPKDFITVDSKKLILIIYLFSSPIFCWRLASSTGCHI